MTEKDNEAALPRVAILAFDDTLEMSISITRDIFAAANRVSLRHVSSRKMSSRKAPSSKSGNHTTQGLIRVLTLNGEPVRTFSGSLFYPDGAIADDEAPDLIIISGVWTAIDPFLKRHRAVAGWLCRQHERGALIASMHSGSFLLAESGLLDNAVASVYWQLEEDFKQRYPRVIVQSERKITSSGNLFCSAGIGSGLELGLYLVQRVYGIAVAERVSRSFLMDVPRQTPAFQLAFDPFKKHSDKKILAAQQWLESNYGADFLMDELADKVGMGLRSFMRRFKSATGDTPLRYLQRVRIEIAKELLSNSTDGIEQVSYRVGYEDVAFFCRLFKRHAKCTPGEFRHHRSSAKLSDKY